MAVLNVNREDFHGFLAKFADLLVSLFVRFGSSLRMNSHVILQGSFERIFPFTDIAGEVLVELVNFGRTFRHSEGTRNALAMFIVISTLFYNINDCAFWFMLDPQNWLKSK